MDWRQQALTEFDREMATTRRILERVPMEKEDWTPHQRSTKLGELASHVARNARNTGLVLTSDELDFATTDRSAWGPLHTREELLTAFDANVASSRAALAAATDEQLAGKWTLRWGDRIIFSEPRTLVHRFFSMNHLIHHRAQLGVYLRLLDVPLPGSYGPTADEGLA